MTMHQEPDHFIYLDNNATTATETAVLAAMLPWFDLRYGNPSSPHQFGHSVRAEVDAARQSIATLLGAERDEEVLFTSGGSESNNTAILSALEVKIDQLVEKK